MLLFTLYTFLIFAQLRSKVLSTIFKEINLQSNMAGNLITSLLSLATNLLPSIRASVQAPSSSSSNYNNSQNGPSRAIEEDLKSMMRTLQRIKDTLYDAEEREIRDRSVKHWLKELKEVAYDAEDVLSEYRYKVTHVQVEERKASEASGSHKRMRNQMECIECIVKIPDGMVDRLNKIRSQFDEIAKDREALQLRESDGVRHLNKKNLRPPTSHMVDEASIFGRDAEKEEIIDSLLSEKEKPFLVISIIGKGGLGKTTIAQLVYKDERVTRCFDLLGWVCVSEEFDVGRLTKRIIESVTKKNYDLSELSSLQEKLAETVNGKTIVLVLDDVWNENQSLWELLRVPFKEAKLVRILVTTRNKKVADVVQTTTCFSPTNLPEDSCWKLFQHYAFCGTTDTMPKQLVDVGREIMKKYGGLPLAVKSVASLLGHKTDEKRWRDILECDLWELNSSNFIFPALQISFAHLPPHLKRCFLFCSMYPKDYIFEKMELIKLWISLGYIESSCKREIEEIAGEYFEELQERSFLDEFFYFYSDEDSECCKLHDIIHDLARFNSENEHYSVEINQPLEIQKENVPQEACHLYVRGFIGYVNQILKQNMKGLRTLSMDLRACGSDLEHEYCITNAITMDLNSKMSECSKDVQICNLTQFEALRILELKLHNLTRIPDSISVLKHLSYLCITSSGLKILPPSICILYNLQTLLLYCIRLECLPESIGDLLKLQVLYIQSFNLGNLPKSLGSLSNLLRLVITREIYLEYVPHGLDNFPAIKTMNAWLTVRIVAWLKDMIDLEGNLSIYGVSNLKDAQCANIRNMCKLETLDLCSYHDFNMSDGSEKSELLLSVEQEGSMDKWDGVEDEGGSHDDGVDDEWDGIENEEVSHDDGVGHEWDGVEDEGGSHDDGVDNELDGIEDEEVSDDDGVMHEGDGVEDEVVSVDDVHFSWLGSLQPHPNLKKLRVRYYSLATVPGWMSDPCSLQSIQEVLLEGCYIQSLPFIELHTLKHLSIHECYGLGVFQLEQLPSQLEELEIKECAHLELITGLGNLDKLKTLKICSCKVLQSIKMDGQQLVESSEPIGDSSNENPQISQQSISSLTKLKILYCDLLCVLPDGLIPSGPACCVFVYQCGCPEHIIGPYYNL